MFVSTQISPYQCECGLWNGIGGFALQLYRIFSVQLNLVDDVSESVFVAEVKYLYLSIHVMRRERIYSSLCKIIDTYNVGGHCT